MTNKYKYFIANWKMFGNLKSLNSLNKVIHFAKSYKAKKKVRIIYCPPYVLLRDFVKKFDRSIINAC